MEEKCNFMTCRYNKENTCQNEDAREECVEIAKAVLCIKEDE